MTLAFSTQLNKMPSYFTTKILRGLLNHLLIDLKVYTNYHLAVIKKDFTRGGIENEKIHTIRHDEKDRWKAGNNIHFVINNRTPNRYQFAPVVKCVSVQEINIVYWYNPKTEEFDKPAIYIDKKVLSKKQVEQLAINDGFESVSDFYAYFNTNFNGKLIHWTNTRY